MSIKDKDKMSREIDKYLSDRFVRDSFAGQTMVCMIEELIDYEMDGQMKIDYFQIAETSYDMAEVMMKVRERRYGTVDRPQ